MSKGRLKDAFDKAMSENPFTHLGDAVYSLLYKSIIRMDIPDDELISDTALAKSLISAGLRFIMRLYACRMTA